MIYTPKATCTFSRYSNGNFIKKASEIQIKLSVGTYNAVAPAPTSVIPLIDQMKVYEQESDEGNHKNRLQYKAIRKDITALLKLQCASVNGLSGGNLDFLVNSGFDISKEPTPIPEPLMPTITKVTPLQGGEAIVKLRSVPHADYYKLKVVGPGGFEKWKTSLHSKIKIADLLTGVVLTATVHAVNNKGVGQWSNGFTFELPTNNTQGNGGEE